MRLRLHAWRRVAGLVDGDDAELVPLALAQPRDAGLQLVDPGGWGGAGRRLGGEERERERETLANCPRAHPTNIGTTRSTHTQKKKIAPLAEPEGSRNVFWSPSSLCLAVCVVGDERVEPPAELVLLLDDVVGDGAAAVVGRGQPAKGHRPVFKVDDLELRKEWRR